MKLQPKTEHPHGLSDVDFDSLFTTDKHVIFGFHGYPWLIHRLPNQGTKGAYLKQLVRDKLIVHKHYIRKHGEDLPEIRNWKWGQVEAPVGKPPLEKLGVPKLEQTKELQIELQIVHSA